jgi:WD40 repeat protein
VVKIVNHFDGRATGAEFRHDDRVNGVAFDPDSRCVATAGMDGHVKVWDVTAGTMKFDQAANTKHTFAVAFSPDGKTLASAGWDEPEPGDDGRPMAAPDGGVQVWDVATGRPVRSLPLKGGRFSAVAFSPDGKRLAAAGHGSAADPVGVRVWDLATGDEVLSLGNARRGSMGHVAFSPDGRRIAWSRGDGTVAVSDADGGQELFQVSGVAMAFSPDGTRLATTSSTSVRLWETAAGEEVLTLSGHTLPVMQVLFTPDGRSLVSVGVDWAVKVWDGPP